MHHFGNDLKLLAATDLSARSDRAVERAVQLAGTWKAHLTLLHVVSDELPRSALRAGIDEAEQVLKEQVAPWRESGLDVEYVVAKGHDYEAIISEARKMNAKLIVMGTHRKTLMREHWFGTTVDHVVRHGDRPVLVVRQKPLKKYDRVLVAVDFSSSSRLALEFALLLFPGAQFFVLNAYHVPFSGFTSDVKYANHFGDEADQAMISFVNGVLTDFRTRFGAVTSELQTIVEEGSAARWVHAKAKEFECDLVVLGTHGRTGFRHAVLGSIAEDLISTLPVDVLAVRPPREKQ